MTKLIIFDFDGTLINSLPLYLKTLKKSNPNHIVQNFHQLTKLLLINQQTA